MLVGELVTAGANPANVIVEPIANGATACAAYVNVAVPVATVNPVAVRVAVVDAATCGVLHTYVVPPYTTKSLSLYLEAFAQVPAQLNELANISHLLKSCSNPKYVGATYVAEV